MTGAVPRDPCLFSEVPKTCAARAFGLRSHCQRKDTSMALVINDPPAARMSQAELAAWRDMPAAIISDEVNRTGTMHTAIAPLRPGMGFAAQALTVHTMVGDNVTLHYAVTAAWPGCALVVDARGHADTALWGAILTEAAKARGVVALVIDGGVRDAAELRASGMAVYARGIVPDRPQRSP